MRSIALGLVNVSLYTRDRAWLIYDPPRSGLWPRISFEKVRPSMSNVVKADESAMICPFFCRKLIGEDELGREIRSYAHRLRVPD